MQLIKKEIRTNNHKAEKQVQLTIDEDFNVPDTKQDIDKIITSRGQVVIDDTEPMVDRLRVRGHVSYRILYSVAKVEGELDAMEGSVPFEEMINVDDLLPSYDTSVSCEIEDLNITMIHSRKVEVKGLIQMKIDVTEQDVLEGAEGIENGDGIQCLYKKVPYTRTVADQRDVFRVREMVPIPQNKPNIRRMIWYCATLNDVETKPLDNKIDIRGELEVFLIYRAEEQMPIQYLNLDIPFSGEVECVGSMEGMTADIGVNLGETQLNVEPDEDGEERVLNLEANLELAIRIYQEEELDLLGDMFSTSACIQVETEQFDYESLLTRNNAKTRIVERIKRKENQAGILQVCYVEGTVKVDDIRTTEEGVVVDGAVEVRLLYIAEDDTRPMNSMTGYLPFTYLVEAKNLSPDTIFHITPTLEQISSIMLGSDEVEIKAVMNLSIIAFVRKQCPVIVDMSVAEIDYEKMNQLAGIIGYMVQEGDTLWTIAKRYFTSIDSIRKVNQLERDELSPGQKLVIVKG